MNDSLRFGFDADMVVMKYLFWFQWIIEGLVFIFLHSTILQILLSRKTEMKDGIRRGFYCGGFLCHYIRDIEMRVVMFFYALSVTSVVPCFLYISFRIYTYVVSYSDAKFYVGQREQTVILIVSTAILGINVAAFGVVVEESEYTHEIYNTSEIRTLLNTMGGRIVILGRPGDPEKFTYEIYFFFLSVALILPVLSGMMLSARRVIQKRERIASSKTHEVEDRLAKVFFVQIVSVILFYCFPLVALFSLMIIDTSHWPGWTLAIIRPAIMTLLTLKSTVQSLNFLLKNPQYTKRILQQVVHIFQCMKPAETSSISMTSTWAKSTEDHLCFVSRTLSRPHKIALLSQKNFVVLLTTSVLIFQIIWFLTCFTLGEPENLNEIRHYLSLFRQEYERNVNEVIMNYWGNGELCLRPFLLLIFADSVEIASFAVVASLATLKYLELRKAPNISDKIRRFQLQILIAAVAQTLTPIIFVYVPYLFNVNSSLFHIFPPDASAIAMLLLSSFPCIDAVVIIVLMKPYRDGLRKLHGLSSNQVKIVANSAFTAPVHAVQFISE